MLSHIRWVFPTRLWAVYVPGHGEVSSHLDWAAFPLFECFTVGMSFQLAFEWVRCEELEGICIGVATETQVMHLHLELMTAETINDQTGRDYHYIQQ